MTDTIRAPWTPKQVENLNRFQQYGGMHPFTCGNDQHGVNVVLMAHRDGWHCSDPACGYRQDWAHDFMADPSVWPKPWQQFTAHPVTPEMEQAATERAEQAAEESARSAAWLAIHNAPASGSTAATGHQERRTPEPDAIAYRIRAELVCCNVYGRVNDTHELTIQQAMESRDWHDLCYWGEASARLAEGRYPGYETEPNICRCPCEGCKHNCSAHQEDNVDQADPDTCRLVEVDGETIRVRGAGEMSDESRAALADVIQAAKRKYAAEHPEPPAESLLEKRLRLAHQARRAKEQQLDGIRRALCDVGAIQDDDPYSHADLEDVIRQALTPTVETPDDTDTTEAPATITDPAWLRDQYAAAVRDAACTGDCGQSEEECSKRRIQPFVWHHGKLAVVEGSPEMFADAVLRVRDRHLEQLRQRLQLAAAEPLDRHPAIAAWGNAYDRANTAEQRVRELESIASDADRLRRDWTGMRDRAEQAEATLREVLDTFGRFENGPGLVRSGAISAEQFARWAAALNPSKEPTGA